MHVGAPIKKQFYSNRKLGYLVILFGPEIAYLVKKMAGEVVVEAVAGPVSKNARQAEFERQLELLSKKE